MRLDYEANVCVAAINFYSMQLIIRSIDFKKMKENYACVVIVT